MDIEEGEFYLISDTAIEYIYIPKQIEIHAPSEHTIDGEHFDLELQMLHYYKGTDEMLGAIISIFFDTENGSNALNVDEKDKDANNFLNELFEVIDKGRGEINLEEFLQYVNFKEFWTYKGSLTRPPCQEGINWVIIKAAQSLS